MQSSRHAILTEKTPIVVDLDGTLIVTDSLYERFVHGLFHRPLALIAALPHLLQGRRALKAALASRVQIDAKHLPLREDLIAWLHREAGRGRDVHLCSAADQSVVDAIAGRLGIFASAAGSSEVNLKGKHKADLLSRTFAGGFCYVGDNRADLAVWEVADSIVLAGARPAVARAARALGKPIEAEFVDPPLTLKELLGALRVHHWSKNALIFVPLILDHAWHDRAAVIEATLGFLCLLLATSATYVLNDLADLDADRQHWSKRHRSLASGRLTIPKGFVLAGSALAAAVMGAVLLSLDFAAVLCAYVVLTLAYSLGLKRVPLLDTLVIGILFTTRLLMGIALVTHGYSEWLLTFSMFFFFSMAVAKRHGEIVRAGDRALRSLPGRGYRVEDGPLTLVFGASAAMASLVIMVLFIVEQVRERNLYDRPAALWGVPIVLSIWIGRIWLLAHRGQMTDDPVSFALRDPVSLVLAGIVSVIFLIAL